MKYLKKLFETEIWQDLSKYHADPNRYGYRVGRFIPNSPPEQFHNFRGGRGTGHFGTGFYFVGVNSTETISKNPNFIFDLNDYNLYHPRNNGYKLHDILKELTNFNKITIESLIDDLLLDKHFKEISKKFISIELDNLMDDDKISDKYNRYKEYYNDKQDMIEDYKSDIIKDFQKCHTKWNRYVISDIIQEFLNTQKILMFIKDIDFYLLKNDLINKYENFIKKEMNTYKPERNECYQAVLKKYITPLVDLVNDTCHKPKTVIQKAAIDTLNEQSEWDAYDEKYWRKPIFATRFFSKLGYDGIDVRNTNLDNTMYGCVIWNIKPEDVIKVK
jgi:hypothetical protein